jgi:tRNA threonylcarbamoyladenosine biosynthesis protein TsaB
MTTLALDASTYQGSVAILDGATIVAEATAAMRGRDAERLMPAVQAALKSGGLQLADVERIVCGSGPGSFTSLRIAGSIAKGLALGAAKPLFAISSLALLVAGNAREPGRYLALLDAMRGEYFAAAFDFDGIRLAAASDAELIAAADVDSHARRFDARPAGPDFPENWQPHARGARFLHETLAAAGPVTLATWEPTYGRLAEAQVRLEARSV